MTRIAKGRQNGELWDRVKLDNGMVGYVFQNYIEIVKPEINININGNIITGIQEKTTVQQIIEKMNTNYIIQIVDRNGKRLTNNNIVGTGCVVKLLNDQTLVNQYQVILYGDADGDGKINSIDLLVIQRHILGVKSLSSIYKKASNINKTGKDPTSVDLLKIQRYILGIETIKQ